MLAREIEGAAQGEPRVGRGARRRLVREHRPRVARIRARTARGEPVPLVRLALGGVADKQPLPWNSAIGVNMNYRAAVETLTNSQTGILDIL